MNKFIGKINLFFVFKWHCEIFDFFHGGGYTIISINILKILKIRTKEK